MSATSERSRDTAAMRILMTATFPFPEGTLGASRALHMQARGLSKAGHEVLVAVSRASVDGESADLGGFRMKSFGSAVGAAHGFRGRLRWLSGQVRMLGYLLGSILKRRFDSVVFYGPAPMFAIAALVARVRRQQTGYIQGDALNVRVRPLHVLAEVALARSAALIIVGGSSLLAAHLSRMAPATRQVKLWPPTDTDYFAAGNAARARTSLGIGNAPLVVYAGAVSSLDGVDLLIRAMTSVVARVPGARLVIAGFVLDRDPILGDPLRYADLVEMLGLGKNVRLTGPLSIGELADLYAAADVLVNPKIDHPINRMAAPIKIGEYLAAGRPVLTTRVCELEEWLVDGGDVLFCDAGDSNALAAGICELMRNRELADRLSRGCAEVARRVCDYRAWGLKVAEAMADARDGV